MPIDLKILLIYSILCFLKANIVLNVKVVPDDCFKFGGEWVKGKLLFISQYHSSKVLQNFQVISTSHFFGVVWGVFSSLTSVVSICDDCGEIIFRYDNHLDLAQIANTGSPSKYIFHHHLSQVFMGLLLGAEKKMYRYVLNLTASYTFELSQVLTYSVGDTDVSILSSNCKQTGV